MILTRSPLYTYSAQILICHKKVFEILYFVVRLNRQQTELNFCYSEYSVNVLNFKWHSSAAQRTKRHL